MTVPDTEALHNERDKTMNPIVYAIPVFMLTILLEAWVARRRGVAVYDIPDAITSLHHGVLSQVTNAFTKIATLGIYIAVYEAYRFTEWSMSSIPLWILALVLYDLSSSYFEGSTCPLAKRGYSRDGRPGTLQVNYGLLTDARGCPVAVSVFEGNTADSQTFVPAVARVRERFGLAQVVMVGDRGMVSQKAIDELRGQGGIDWITALKSVSIRSLVEHGHLQLGLFDQRNLAEITSPDYPGERLVACRNDALAKLRAHKRESLLQATEALLALIKASVDAGRLTGQDKIGVQVGKIINRHKVAKHFELTITDTSLTWERKDEAIAAEAALDGLYVIRTSLGADKLDAGATVHAFDRDPDAIAARLQQP